MSGVLAVAVQPQGFALVAAALAGAAALLLREPRARAGAMLAALVLAGAALAIEEGGRLSDTLNGRAGLAAAVVVAAVIGLVALAELLRRRPALVALLAFAALPFRVPVPLGDDTASLLLPLYAVIAAGAIARCLAALRGGAAPPQRPHDRALRRLEWALAIVLVLYAAQSVYSTDVEQATVAVCFFYVPFAVLFGLLLDVPWSRRLLLGVFGVVVGLALLFAAVGFVEWATGRLLISNAKVLRANEIKPYFRVNSLFFDPNVYGRFLALTMIALAAALPALRRGRDVALAAVALGVLWWGLVVSLSQSSFAALLAGLLVLAALRFRARVVAGAVVVALAIGVAVVIAAPEQVGLHTGSSKALDTSTSGRTDLVKGGLRMARDRPAWGFGSGSFGERFRARERVRSTKSAAVSHTIPVTVAAEQGAIGLAAYVWLLVTAFALLFAGLRGAARAGPAPAAIARVATAAAYAGLVLHTFVYADFLEDPLAWALLALAAALRAAAAREPAEGGSARAAAPAPEAAPA